MTNSKPSFAEVGTRLWDKVREHPGYVLGAAMVVFLVHPKPFLKLLRPVIRHIANKYDQLEYQSTETIILSTRFLDKETLYGRLGVDQHRSLRVIDFLKHNSAQEETAEVWGSILHDKIRQTRAEIVVVVARPSILQQCQASFYGMEQSELHKLSVVSQSSIHMLVRCLDSYELKELTLVV